MEIEEEAAGRRAESFGEKQFYLDEFRGRTLVLAVPYEQVRREEEASSLAAVVRELIRHDSRVILVVSSPGGRRRLATRRNLQGRLGRLLLRRDTRRRFPPRHLASRCFLELPEDDSDTTEVLAQFWLRLRVGPLAVGLVTGDDLPKLAAKACLLATRLRAHKLVLLDPDGGIAGTDEKPLSFMDEGMLETLLAVGQAEWSGLGARRPILEAARRALLGDVASVNLCTTEGLARELFTYTGSGTLFTRADYCTVQRLGIDDYEEVERLIERGQREEVLKQRTPEEVARLLASGYGATIGTHHLAGICALESELFADEGAGEIVGLYTVTRFKWEGIGSKLLARATADARAAGLRYLFACTTETKAVAFFEREGFRQVEPEDVPAGKWTDYDPRRRRRLVILRRDLAPVGCPVPGDRAPSSEGTVPDRRSVSGGASSSSSMDKVR